MADEKSCEVDGLSQQFYSFGESTVKLSLDISEALKGLKAIQREAKKATAALKELESSKGESTFLSIELEAIDSVPKIYYKGEEIKGKIHIGFDWSTQTSRTVLSPMIDIQYADTSSKRPSIKRITHNPFDGDQE